MSRFSGKGGTIRSHALAKSILMAALGAVAPVALAAEPDVWARVPALPTGCYQSDGFGAKISAAHETLKSDVTRQEAINKQLQDQAQTIDPMELASRQQQYMMDHPQEAMKMMQRTQSLGTQEANDVRVKLLNEQKNLQQELDGIDTRYKAALDARFAPINAKFKELDARAQKDFVKTEAGSYYAAWAVKEWNALNAQLNTAYESVCAEWWAGSGPFRGWLKRYRENLEQQIPQREEGDALGAGFMVIMIGTPKASFKSTATLDAVDQYMEQVGKVFERRWPQPVPPAEGVEAGGRAALK